MTVVLNSLLPMVEECSNEWGGGRDRFVSDFDGELTIAISRNDVTDWLSPDNLDDLEKISLLTEFVNAGRDELKLELPREIKDVFEWVVQSVVVTADGWVVVVTPKSWEARTI